MFNANRKAVSQTDRTAHGEPTHSYGNGIQRVGTEQDGFPGTDKQTAQGRDHQKDHGTGHRSEKEGLTNDEKRMREINSR